MATQGETWQQQERDYINRFFTITVPSTLPLDAKPCAEDTCIAFAKAQLDTDDLKPVDNQGANSYTLISPNHRKIIQFRPIPFQDEIIDLAHQIYGGSVPVICLQDEIPLHVYTSDVIPGKVHVLQSFGGSDFPLERQRRTIIDLAKFFAKATYFPQPRSALAPESFTASAPQTLDRLARNKSLTKLAPEIVSIVAKLQSLLPLLDTLPLVLSHDDLSELNFLVDDNGSLTGVIDFDNAGIEAFGMSMWDVYECLLGMMEKGIFSFYDQVVGNNDVTVRESLEKSFWKALWESVSPQVITIEDQEAVRVALCIGVIKRYFIQGMIDDIDENIKVHTMSLEYAKKILPAVSPQRKVIAN